MKVILGAYNYLSSRLPVYINTHSAVYIDNRQENMAIENNTSYRPKKKKQYKLEAKLKTSLSYIL